MAPISTIFGPNESQRCQLKFEKAVETISVTAKTSKHFREKFENPIQNETPFDFSIQKAWDAVYTFDLFIRLCQIHEDCLFQKPTF